MKQDGVQAVASSVTAVRRRNFVRILLRAGIERQSEGATKARQNRRAKEASIYEASLRTLRAMDLALGPLEIEPKPLLLLPGWRVDDGLRR